VCLGSLSLSMGSRWLTKQEDAQQAGSLMMNYFRRFQQSIKQSEYPKSIPVFADELNITPVHLNRICKAVSGKSAIELVHQNLINEAQKYLLHTSYSVSEISYLLKFEYPNYFAKLFKKYVGMSPNEYRKHDRKWNSLWFQNLLFGFIHEICLILRIVRFS